MRNSTPLKVLKALKTGATSCLREGKSQRRLNFGKITNCLWMIVDNQTRINKLFEIFPGSFYRQTNHGIEGNHRREPIRNRVSLQKQRWRRFGRILILTGFYPFLHRNFYSNAFQRVEESYFI